MPKKASARKQPAENPAGDGRAQGPGGRVLPQIQEFYRFMLDQKLDTLEYDHQGLHVRLVRRRPAPMPVPVAVGAPAASYAAPAPAGDAPARHAPSARTLPPNASVVASPMMGIFYRASSPSSPPFVKVGDSVKKGQVVCLIEAMKVFNEVKADFDCAVLGVSVENGKPVKVGQELLVIEKK